MRSAAVFLFVLMVPAVVRGQSPGEPVSRADVAVSAGWLAADRSIDRVVQAFWLAWYVRPRQT
jgi:hypothetical protein